MYPGVLQIVPVVAVALAMQGTVGAPSSAQPCAVSQTGSMQADPTTPTEPKPIPEMAERMPESQIGGVEPGPPESTPAAPRPGDPPPVQDLNPNAPLFAPGEVIILVHDVSRMSEAVQAIGGASVRSSSMPGWFLVQLAAGVSVDDALARAKSSALIDAAEPNFGAQALTEPAPQTC
jgi:hypothetical protein